MFSKRFSRPNISICFGTRPGTFFALALDTIMGWQKAKITKVPWIFLCDFSLLSVTFCILLRIRSLPQPNRETVSSEHLNIM
jgi:hypothetical protein